MTRRKLFRLIATAVACPFLLPLIPEPKTVSTLKVTWPPDDVLKRCRFEVRAVVEEIRDNGRVLVCKTFTDVQAVPVQWMPDSRVFYYERRPPAPGIAMLSVTPDMTLCEPGDAIIIGRAE